MYMYVCGLVTNRLKSTYKLCIIHTEPTWPLCPPKQFSKESSNGVTDAQSQHARVKAELYHCIGRGSY